MKSHRNSYIVCPRNKNHKSCPISGYIYVIACQVAVVSKRGFVHVRNKIRKMEITMRHLVVRRLSLFIKS